MGADVSNVVLGRLGLGAKARRKGKGRASSAKDADEFTDFPELLPSRKAAKVSAKGMTPFRKQAPLLTLDEAVWQDHVAPLCDVRSLCNLVSTCKVQ
jgi:hypothetical protein